MGKLDKLGKLGNLDKLSKIWSACGEHEIKYTE
jgi:hypothetical protein